MAVEIVHYKCSGLNEHEQRCNKLLFVWKPGLHLNGGPRPDLGQAEVKCRRCRTVNIIRFAYAGTAAQDLNDTVVQLSKTRQLQDS